MANATVSPQAQNGQAPGGGTAPPIALPDINAETYPFEVVLTLLDQAAFFNMFSIPDPERSDTAIPTPSNQSGVIGVRVKEVLHRFHIIVPPPTLEKGMRAANVVGETIGKFSHRWMVIPPGFEALPDREPPPTPLDPSRSQRFAMMDGICTFGNGKDGFRGFGTGLTFPVTANGQSQLLAAAVGNIMEGFGKFKDHEGTYTYSGQIDPTRGFQGHLLCRVVDPEGTLRTEKGLLPLKPVPNPEPGVTYIQFRGQKKDKNSKTVYDFKPDGQMEGFHLSQQLRQIFLDFSDQATPREGTDLQAEQDIGQVIGTMTSKVFLNLLNPNAPPGTGLAPIPFSSYNVFTFSHSQGQLLGSFAAEGGEGRTFNMAFTGAPGQQALRFGAFQTLANGTGCFSGVQGLLTDNSVVGVAPHATSTLYTVRIIDPHGKFRAAINELKR